MQAKDEFSTVLKQADLMVLQFSRKNTEEFIHELARTLPGKQRLMKTYKAIYPCRRAFHEELCAFGMKKEQNN